VFSHFFFFTNRTVLRNFKLTKNFFKNITWKQTIFAIFWNCENFRNERKERISVSRKIFSNMNFRFLVSFTRKVRIKLPPWLWNFPSYFSPRSLRFLFLTTILLHIFTPFRRKYRQFLRNIRKIIVFYYEKYFITTLIWERH